MTGKELERKSSKDMTQSSEGDGMLPLTVGESVVVKFPLQGLSMDEVDLIADTQAHLKEVEELAERKGIKLGEVSQDNEESDSRVVVAVGYQQYKKIDDTTEYPEGSNVIVKVDGATISRNLIRRNSTFYERKLKKAIRKATKFAETFGRGVTITSTEIDQSNKNR